MIGWIGVSNLFIEKQTLIVQPVLGVKGLQEIFWDPGIGYRSGCGFWRSMSSALRGKRLIELGMIMRLDLFCDGRYFCCSGKECILKRSIFCVQGRWTAFFCWCYSGPTTKQLYSYFAMKIWYRFGYPDSFHELVCFTATSVPLSPWGPHASFRVSHREQLILRPQSLGAFHHCTISKSSPFSSHPAFLKVDSIPYFF